MFARRFRNPRGAPKPRPSNVEGLRADLFRALWIQGGVLAGLILALAGVMLGFAGVVLTGS